MDRERGGHNEILVGLCTCCVISGKGLDFLSLSFLSCKVGVIMVVMCVPGPGTWSALMHTVSSHAHRTHAHTQSALIHSAYD